MSSGPPPPRPSPYLCERIAESVEVAEGADADVLLNALDVTTIE